MFPDRHNPNSSTCGTSVVCATRLETPIDPNGNLTTKTEGSDTWAYTWNANNELTRVTKNSIEQATFGYDPRGRRVERQAGGVTTTYIYDDDLVLREARGSTTLNYVHGPAIDEPLVVDDGTTLSYVHADGLGSIAATTDQSGAVTATRRYDAWGNLEVGASQPGPAFTGRDWDPVLGLYYYRARYYDAGLGGFISEDPLQFRAGYNFYAYVQSNPATLIDPFGLQASKNLFRMGSPEWQAAQKHLDHPKYYTVAAHGLTCKCALEDQTSPTPYKTLTARDLAHLILSDPKYQIGQPVKLLVCWGAGFAQDLADQMLVEVVATPDEILWSPNEVFKPNYFVGDRTWPHFRPRFGMPPR